MDALFAQPTQPASAPRVRAFAELAMKEIGFTGGVGGESNGTGTGNSNSLLADKYAFSQFMDRVNESVLLGFREPPLAASVLNDLYGTGDNGNLRTGEEDSGEPAGPDNDFLSPSPLPPSPSPSPPPSPSRQSLDVNTSSRTEPSALSTSLAALSSKLLFSPRRQTRRIHDHNRDHHTAKNAPLLQSRPSDSAAAHRVRFEGNTDGDGCNRTASTCSPGGKQRQGDDDEEGLFKDQEQLGERRNEDSSKATPSPTSCCCLEGPTLLQELRRWRKETSIDIDIDHGRSPPLFPRNARVISGRGSGRCSTPFTGGPPNPLAANSCLGAGDRVHSDATSPPPRASRELQDSRERGWHHDTSSSIGSSSKDSDDSRSNADSGGRGAGSGSPSRTQESSRSGDVWMRNRGAVRSGTSARLDGPPPAPASTPSAPADLRYRSQPVLPLHRLAGEHASAMSPGNERWRSRLGSERGTGGRIVPEGGRGCFSRVEGSVRAMGGGDGDGSGQEEGESNTVTSLDLSDCSDEKLGAILKRGRRC